MADTRENAFTQASSFDSGDFLRIVKALATVPDSQVMSRAVLKAYLDTLYPPLGGVLESDLALLTDITTANASASKHGLMPKWDGDATHFFSGAGTQIVTPYTIPLQAGNFNPTDATTYYFGHNYGAAPGSVAAANKVYPIRGGTITRVNVYLYNNGGTQGSSETSTMSLRLNNTSDTAISSSITANAASGTVVVFQVTGLSLAVATTDYFEVKWVTPTWATNPTAVVPFVEVYIS
jgi:hypothetical protein